MSSSSVLGVVLALISAGVWGSGDFTGGVATRRANQFQVLALSSLSGLVVLVAAAIISKETFPSPTGILWSMLAGVAGATGIVSLYKALSIGESAIVAPTSSLLGAGLPVLFGFLTQGLPKTINIVGFGLALVGIWIVSQGASGSNSNSKKGFLLACLAGVGFAGFMICISQVEAGKVFTPLIVERVVMFAVSLLLMGMNKLPFPSFRLNPVGILAGILDAGGNIFFLLSKQYLRMDMAVIISSLYPVVTVILTGIIFKEKVTFKQWIGVVICLASVILITL